MGLRNFVVATNPETTGSGRLKISLDPERLWTTPPAASTSATPAAMSHSLFGVRVQVASARPAATWASLYATEPIGRTFIGPALKRFQSPRFHSLRLASTRTWSREIVFRMDADFPLWRIPAP